MRPLALLMVAFAVLVNPAARGAQFTLRWTDNSSNESGFRVERSTNGTTFTEIASVPANVVAYTDANLPNSTTYWYRLRAFNGAGLSGYSNVATGTTPPAPTNTAPTISSIANQTLASGTSTASLGFTVADAETTAGSLAVSATSSNTALVAQSGLVLGGSGGNRTIIVTPISGTSGSATITITVSDGVLRTSSSFSVTVNPANVAPTMTAIPNTSINEDRSTAALALTIADANTPLSSLSLSATSSNTALLPNAAIVFGGSGANRTVSATPLADASGTATITISVSDGSLTTTRSFVLTVAPVNDAPSISAIAGQSLAFGTVSAPLAFTVQDADTPPAALAVTATSSNPALLPAQAIILGGTGVERTVTVNPAAGQFGTATVSLTVSDGSLTATSVFDVTVGPPDGVIACAGDGFVNTALPAAQTGRFEVRFEATPSADRVDALVALSPAAAARYADLAAIVRFNTSGMIDARSGGVYTAASAIPYAGGTTYRFRVVIDATTRTYAAWVATGAGPETQIGENLAYRTEQALAPSLATWSVMMNPLNTGQWIRVSGFTLTVTPRNTAPVISEIPNIALVRDLGSETVSFIVGDAECVPEALTVVASSSNADLVPVEAIVLGGTGGTRTATVTPRAGQVGIATIALTASDGELSATETFEVTVLPPPPVVARAGDGFLNTALTPAQGGLFEVVFEATPSAAPIDAVVGLAAMPASRYADLAAIVRFSSLGTIDARSGSRYTADSSIPYTAGMSYRIRLLVDTRRHTYSAYVTAPQSGERLLGADLAFRTEQAAVSTLTHWTASVLAQFAGQSIAVAGFTVTALPDNTAPVMSDLVDVSITEGGSSGAISFAVDDAESGVASLTITASCSDPALVPSSGLVLAGIGTDRTVSITPAPYASGSASVTLAVSDGSLTTFETFQVTVVPRPATLAAAGAGFINTPLASPLTGRATVTFEATPSTSSNDSTVGLAAAPATRYADLATIVRFNTAGMIDARNGSAYTAAGAIAYTAGTTYRFRLVIDVVSRRYSAFVTPAGGTELTIGTNLAFRTEQAGVTQVSTWSTTTLATPGAPSLTVSRFAVRLE